MDPVRSAGSTDPPALAREIRLLAEMGVGYPDNMFSDTNTGTMSRADVLERNTHLKFLSAQRSYSFMIRMISKCVVKMAIGEDAAEDTDVMVSWPKIVTPATMEQAGTLIQLYQADAIPKKVMVEEALKLLNREDRHEILLVLFPQDEDGMELKSDSDLDMMGQMNMGQPGSPVEGNDPNNPMAAMESWIDNELMAEYSLLG